MDRLLAVTGGIVGGALVVMFIFEREWRRALASHRPQY
jgi:hypothetical protein